MKRIFTTIILLICISQSASFAYSEKNLLQKTTTINHLKEILLTNQKWVAYPNYNDRNGWDKYLGRYKSEIIKKGEEAIKYKWQVITATDYLDFSRSGNRSRVENKYNSNFHTIANLLVAELAEGKGRFVDQLINGVFYASEMTTWAIPAHLHLQETKQLFPDYNDNVIELASGDVGALMSWIYYFMHEQFDKVHPFIAKRLKYEIQRRILDPYINTDRFWWMAFNYKSGDMVNNWNPWCNANVLQSFLLIENDKDKLAQAVYRTMQSVDHYINYNEDGAPEEGPTYWGHGIGKLLDYLQVLYDATGGGVSIFNNKLIKNMGEYIYRSYIGDNWVVNFADSPARFSPKPYLVFRYGSAVNSSELKSFASFLYSNEDKESILKIDRDFYRFAESLKFKDEIVTYPKEHKKHVVAWYPKTEFCYMYDKKSDVFVAAKGGYNNESHNHNDVGSFIYYANNKPFIIDVGVGTYTKKTFSAERYSIWTMQSQYHNLPIIDGKVEEYGSLYKATNVNFNSRRKLFSMDIHTAYLGLNLDTKWNRSYQLKGSELIIKDKFSIVNPSITNELVFMICGNIQIFKPGLLIICVDDKCVELKYDGKQFAPIIEDVHIDDPKISNVWGSKIYRLKLKALYLKNRGEYVVRISAK